MWPFVSLVAGGIVFLVTLVVALEDVVFSIGAQETTGTVASVARRQGRSTVGITSVAFSVHGRAYKAAPGSFINWIGRPALGQSVEVLYDPANPSSWRTGPAWMRVTVDLGIVALLFGGLAAYAYVVHWRRTNLGQEFLVD